MLINNRNYLRLHNRSLLEKIKKSEDIPSKTVTVEVSKKGDPTLKVNIEGKTQYIHSKYDPKSEADRFVTQLEKLDKYKHVLFIGVGLGYHIKALLIKYPMMKFSIYEPNIEVLYQFLAYQSLEDPAFTNLYKIFSGGNQEDILQELNDLYQFVGSAIFIKSLPVYENVYESEVKSIMKEFRELLMNKRSNIATNASYQTRWTINSIKNFPYVLKTPNILYDIDQSSFNGKPAIIAAAGPSLSEEIENLRYIKEKGLAYIFSAGSAINALIEHDIYPDVACTYDPSSLNQVVFQKIKDRNITEIPLIFGSSVGYETIEDYPGVMLHMVTSQDPISPRLIDRYKDIDIVLDAPSIAVITFQVLVALGCSQIILVGQNLAFQNNYLYAKGITYEHVSSEISEEQRKSLITVKDVEGNDIQTNENFNQMRKQLESYIDAVKNIEIINTTKGGAKIKGTRFLHLSEVINTKLDKYEIVDKFWTDAGNHYDIAFVNQKLTNIKNDQVQSEKIINESLKILKKIEALVSKRQLNRIELEISEFESEFNRLKKNLFYQSFMEPMLRIQNQRLSDESKSIRLEQNLLKKGEVVVEFFRVFLKECQQLNHFVLPYFEELQEKVEQISTLREKR